MYQKLLCIDKLKSTREKLQQERKKRSSEEPMEALKRKKKRKKKTQETLTLGQTQEKQKDGG